MENAPLHQQQFLGMLQAPAEQRPGCAAKSGSLPALVTEHFLYLSGNLVSTSSF